VFSFQSLLVRPEGTGTWTYALVPSEIEALLNKRGQIKVKGSVNGISIQSSFMPQGNHQHYIVINKTLRDQAGVQPGDIVYLDLELDHAERQVAVPAELDAALNLNPATRQAFNALSYSHQKEYADFIQAAKKPETRSRRIQKALAMLAVNQNLK
jgi:hypothetical protein